MTTFLLRAAIDPDRSSELPLRRSEHLVHIERRGDDIVFGGVLGSADGPPNEIVIVLVATSADDVRAWAAEDPYADLYASVEVGEFHLRRPFTN